MDKALERKMKEEGNIQFFTHKNLPCFIIRPLHLNIWKRNVNDGLRCFHLCGYVGVPKGHILYGKHGHDYFDLKANVHGGLTFAGFLFPNKDYWFFGFDCAHGCDLCYEPFEPFQKSVGDYQSYKDAVYVRKNLVVLAEFLARDVKRK
jgi:hypothetical protein